MLIVTILLIVIAALLYLAVDHLSGISATLRSLQRTAGYTVARLEAKEDALVEYAAGLEDAWGPIGPQQMSVEEWRTSFVRRYSPSDACGRCGIDLKTSPSIWHSPPHDIGFCSASCIAPIDDARRAAALAKLGGRAAMRLFRQDQGMTASEVDKEYENEDKRQNEAWRRWEEKRESRINQDFVEDVTRWYHVMHPNQSAVPNDSNASPDWDEDDDLPATSGQQNPAVLGAFRDIPHLERIYASLHEGRTKGQKEQSVVATLLESMKAAGDVRYVDPRLAPEDPPDCHVTTQTGEVVAVEVTEFVSQEAVEHNERARPARGRHPALGQMIMAQWDKAAFTKKLSYLLTLKDNKKLKGGPYSRYVMVAFTDEPLLIRADAEAWLRDTVFGPCDHIDEAYFLFSYEPGHGYPYASIRLGGT